MFKFLKCTVGKNMEICRRLVSFLYFDSNTDKQNRSNFSYTWEYSKLIGRNMSSWIYVWINECLNGYMNGKSDRKFDEHITYTHAVCVMWI